MENRNIWTVTQVELAPLETVAFWKLDRYLWYSGLSRNSYQVNIVDGKKNTTSWELGISVSKRGSAIWKSAPRATAGEKESSNHCIQLQISITLDPCGKQNRISGHTIVYYPASRNIDKGGKITVPENKTKNTVRPDKILKWDTELHTLRRLV